MTEYHHTGAVEPETAKAAHAQTVLEVFAGKEVIENGFSENIYLPRQKISTK